MALRCASAISSSPLPTVLCCASTISSLSLGDRAPKVPPHRRTSLARRQRAANPCRSSNLLSYLSLSRSATVRSKFLHIAGQTLEATPPCRHISSPWSLHHPLSLSLVGDKM
ncbi:hypothetical protein AAC387_Pa03g3945 [Persea americana]